MKPIIAYGIVGSYYSDRWEILSITSEKAGHRGMVYGRDEHGNATHHKPNDVTGRFATIELAQAGLQALRQIHNDHAPAIEAAREEYDRLSRNRNETVRQALAELRVTPMQHHGPAGEPSPVVVAPVVEPLA
jgi:hypothetical protein